MVAHAILVPLLLGLLNQTQVVSHVTKRVVENFGRGPQEPAGATVVVAINQLPPYPYRPAPEVDPSDWLVVPPPGRFVLLTDNPAQTCVMGVVLDGVGGRSPAISWTRIAGNVPVTVALPGNCLGAFFGIVDGERESLTLRRIDSFAPVDGHEVLALRDEWQGPYRGERWRGQ